VGEEVSPCLFHDCSGVRGPCKVFSDVDTEELEALLHYVSVNLVGVCTPTLMFPVVHNQLLGLADAKGEVVVRGTTQPVL
jgi:hypothetical protein